MREIEPFLMIDSLPPVASMPANWRMTMAARTRGGIVAIGDAYGGTLELVGQQLPLLGIPTHLLLGAELDRLDALLADGARLVFLETPSNPTLEVFDIAAIAARACPWRPAGGG